MNRKSVKSKFFVSKDGQILFLGFVLKLKSYSVTIHIDINLSVKVNEIKEEKTIDSKKKKVTNSEKYERVGEKFKDTDQT